jgi:hypothetical protein
MVTMRNVFLKKRCKGKECTERERERDQERLATKCHVI